VGYSAQTIHPPPKLTYKRHILGMSTSPRNDSHHPQLCRLRHSSITTPYPRVPYFGLFWDLENPWPKLEHFSPVYACEKRFTSVVLKRSKSVQDKWPKGRVALITKYNTFWHRGAEPQGRFPPFFLYECAPWPVTYIPDFIQTGSCLGEL